MSESHSDILMYFIQTGTDAIAAQSTSELHPSDKLTTDFKPKKYFEVDTFSFGIKLEDDEGKSEKASAKQGAKVNEVEDKSKDASQSYARWRSLGDDTVKPSPPFRAEPEDFSIVRSVDASSPVLLQFCLNIQRLDKAVLVKRTRSPQTGKLTGTFRMEFTKVYLKSVEWMDGDAVKETCKFKFASFKVVYVKRKPDGTPASNWPCSWEPTPNA